MGASSSSSPPPPLLLLVLLVCAALPCSLAFSPSGSGSGWGGRSASVPRIYLPAAPLTQCCTSRRRRAGVAALFSEPDAALAHFEAELALNELVEAEPKTPKKRGRKPSVKKAESVMQAEMTEKPAPKAKARKKSVKRSKKNRPLFDYRTPDGNDPHPDTRVHLQVVHKGSAGDLEAVAKIAAAVKKQFGNLVMIHSHTIDISPPPTLLFEVWCEGMNVIRLHSEAEGDGEIGEEGLAKILDALEYEASDDALDTFGPF
jgi:hypothetical protein